MSELLVATPINLCEIGGIPFLTIQFPNKHALEVFSNDTANTPEIIKELVIKYRLDPELTNFCLHEPTPFGNRLNHLRDSLVPTLCSYFKNLDFDIEKIITEALCQPVGDTIDGFTYYIVNYVFFELGTVLSNIQSGEVHAAYTFEGDSPSLHMDAIKLTLSQFIRAILNEGELLLELLPKESMYDELTKFIVGATQELTKGANGFFVKAYSQVYAGYLLKYFELNHVLESMRRLGNTQIVQFLGSSNIMNLVNIYRPINSTIDDYRKLVTAIMAGHDYRVGARGPEIRSQNALAAELDRRIRDLRQAGTLVIGPVQNLIDIEHTGHTGKCPAFKPILINGQVICILEQFSEVISTIVYHTLKRFYPNYYEN